MSVSYKLQDDNDDDDDEDGTMVVITTMMRTILKTIGSLNNDVKGKENANRLNRLSISKTTTLLVDHITLVSPFLKDVNKRQRFFILIYHFGGTRSKGFAMLRNVPKMLFWE